MKVQLPQALAASGKYEEFAQGPGKRHGRSNSLKWPWLYDILRSKGYSKEKSARISNARRHMRKKGRISVLPAKAAHNPKVLKRLSESKGHVTKGKLTKGIKLSANRTEEFMAFIESIDFACQSKACAPPPVGTGGSKASGGSGGSKAKKGSEVTAAEKVAQRSYNAGYKAGVAGSFDALGRADQRGVSEYWKLGFFDGEGGHPRGRSLHTPIRASEARGDSRPVSYQEFQQLARQGDQQLERFRKNASPITGLDNNMTRLKADSWNEVQNEWGGATIDAHTGQALPQGANKYAITVKDKGFETESIPIGASQEEFNAAMDRAVEKFRPVLEREGHHLGVFRDDDVGRIDFDPVLVVDKRSDVDTIGAATRAIGGAYNFSDGNGYWPPHVRGD